LYIISIPFCILNFLKMETTELIQRFSDLFDEKTVQIMILNAANKGKHWFMMDFQTILMADRDLSDALLEEPEEVLKAAEIVLSEIDTGLNPPKMQLRTIKLPSTQQRHVWEVRAEDVGKMIALKGIINKSSGVIHVSNTTRFECPSCGSIINVLQKGSTYKEPSRCGCGRKGTFRVLGESMADNFKLGLIDDLMEDENKDRSIAREKVAILSNDLTSHETDKLIRPGRKVILNGYFKYEQVVKKNKRTCEFESIFHTNSVEFVEVGWDVVKITNDEKEEIEELAAQDDIIERLAESIADVHGYAEAKIAGLLLLAGAPNIYDENKQLASRGTIHVLLISNPGSGKSYMAKRIGVISPINYFQSAVTASGKGLVASVANDKEMGTWTVHPGVVALAHKGVVVIDEVDKTNKEDYGDHNNAMNECEVRIAKASVKARLDTETSYLATANPENRVFTQHDLYINQIDMPKDFLDRFDLIYPLIAPTESIGQGKIMDIMLDRYSNGKGKKSKKKKIWKPEFTHAFIRKYIAYCRQTNYCPEIDDKLFPFIKKQLTELMKPKGDEQTNISFRQLESIMRFAHASARLRIRDMTEEDVQLALRLKIKSFKELGIIDIHGKFSWATLEDVNEEEISDKHKIKQVFDAALPDGKAEADIEELINKCKEKGIDETTVDDYIAKRKQMGDYFEPKRGTLKRI